MDNSPLILIVDDEFDLRLLMQMTLKRMGINCHCAEDLAEAKRLLQQYRFDVCITDLNLPDGSGLDLVEYINQRYAELPVAVLTAYGNMELAIAALKVGAFDFVSKPIDQQRLQSLIEQALVLRNKSQSQSEAITDESPLIGRSPIMMQLKQTIQKVARSQAPVFITGESGTGKEVVARLVHQLSNRSQYAFVAVNCGAIPNDLLESEFFGHKKGSFTGANHDKQGLIQAAEGGTLFLDEIADLPLNMQVKLLRAIQEKTIRPIGGDKEIPVDFRIISASHQDLERLVSQGRFRQDLFFRLHVIDLSLPALRQRGDDVILLAQHFIAHICEDWEIQEKRLDDASKDFLRSCTFPGNVRELRNLIERAITLCDGDMLMAEHFKSYRQSESTPIISVELAQPVHHELSSLSENISVTEDERVQLPSEGLEAYLEKIEKQILTEALNRTHWNRTLAAKKLGMSFRSLRYRLKKFGLDTDEDEELA